MSRLDSQVEQFTRARAPRDVDNHLFTGAVHKEAESEQEIIARKFANNEISLDGAAGHKVRVIDPMHSSTSRWVLCWVSVHFCHPFSHRH